MVYRNSTNPYDQILSNWPNKAVVKSSLSRGPNQIQEWQRQQLNELQIPHIVPSQLRELTKNLDLPMSSFFQTLHEGLLQQFLQMIRQSDVNATANSTSASSSSSGGGGGGSGGSGGSGGIGGGSNTSNNNIIIINNSGSGGNSNITSSTSGGSSSNLLLSATNSNVNSGGILGASVNAPSNTVDRNKLIRILQKL
ncbi:hypothetical protein RFI_11603, partial [Reticulomyxa filosa]